MTSKEKEKNFFAKRLGSQIRKKREEKGMTQAGLSKASGLTQPVVARLENGGIKRPQKHTLEALSKALDISMNELYSLLYSEGDFSFEINRKNQGRVDISISIPDEWILNRSREESEKIFEAYKDKLSDQNMSMLSNIAEVVYIDEHPEQAEAWSEKRGLEFISIIEQASDINTIREQLDDAEWELYVKHQTGLLTGNDLIEFLKKVAQINEEQAKKEK